MLVRPWECLVVLRQHACTLSMFWAVVNCFLTTPLQLHTSLHVSIRVFAVIHSARTNPDSRVKIKYTAAAALPVILYVNFLVSMTIQGGRTEVAAKQPSCRFCVQVLLFNRYAEGEHLRQLKDSNVAEMWSDLLEKPAMLHYASAIWSDWPETKC